MTKETAPKAPAVEPEAVTPGALQEFNGGLANLECCGVCRFWHRGAQVNEPGRGKFAPCRRYPITAVMMIGTQMGPRGPQMTQNPGTVQTFTAPLDWCGEFLRETRAAAFAKPADRAT